MKPAASDRRRCTRHDLKIPFWFRICNSTVPGQNCLSENLSQDGILFSTDTPLPLGAPLEILLKMPAIISGEGATDWLFSGHVARVDSIPSDRAIRRVAVQFDCFQVLSGHRPYANSLHL